VSVLNHALGGSATPRPGAPDGAKDVTEGATSIEAAIAAMNAMLSA